MHAGWRYARISIRAAAVQMQCIAARNRMLYYYMFHGGDGSEEKELINNEIMFTLQRPTRVSNSLGTGTLDDSVVEHNLQILNCLLPFSWQFNTAFLILNV